MPLSFEANAAGASLDASTVTGANIDETKLGPQGHVGTYEVQKLTEEEAIAQGYKLIKTADDLVAIPNGTNDKFILMNDIDLTGVEWNAKSFKGEFNGNGYTISNLTDEIGLISENYGTIKNLNMTGANISGTDYVGVLVSVNRAGKIENCSVSGIVSATGNNSGGLVGYNGGIIRHAIANVEISGARLVGGLVGYAASSSIIENVSATGNVTASGNDVGGLVANNLGTIKNASASSNVSGTSSVGGLVGYNSGANALIENCSASGNVNAAGVKIGGFVGRNEAKIKNSSAAGNVSAEGAGGFVGAMSNDGVIENSHATGDVNVTTDYAGGFIASGSGSINNSYSTGNVTAEAGRVGGFIGQTNGITITNSYSKGDVNAVGYAVGGFVGYVNGKNNLIENSYSTGNVTAHHVGAGAFIGYGGNNILTIKNSYSIGTIDEGHAFGGGNNVMSENCYSNSEQPAGVNINQTGVTAMPLSWFENPENLMFLGDAYDYYYNPPGLWGNNEYRPEEFVQFQVGANSGEKNQLELNLHFRLYDFYGDVSSVENASATLDRVDDFKERLTEKRSEIGAARNRLESVLESQSVRGENLSSSHSTIVDTDFAFETANLAKMQILQSATSSLLAQANFMPQIALQLLG